MYAELATVLRPGGLLLNGDHLAEDEDVSPVLARLGWALIERKEKRRLPGGHPESWEGWWEAATADPSLAGPAAEREQRRLSEDHHGSESVRLGTHVTALRSAEFTEIGTSGSEALTVSSARSVAANETKAPGYDSAPHPANVRSQRASDGAPVGTLAVKSPEPGDSRSP
jgi:hypothetical protein